MVFLWHFVQRLPHSVMSSRATLPFESAWICISTECTFLLVLELETVYPLIVQLAGIRLSPFCQSGMQGLCGRSDCLPLQTILCQRKCIVSDTPVSEDLWSSQLVLGRPLERLQERSGGYPSPEAQQIEKMLDAGTSRLCVCWVSMSYSHKVHQAE